MRVHRLCDAEYWVIVPTVMYFDGEKFKNEKNKKIFIALLFLQIYSMKKFLRKIFFIYISENKF